MKILYIPAKSKINIKPLIKNLKTKEKLGLITTAQYLHQLLEIKNMLKNSVIGGQILGCNLDNALKIKNKIDSYLFIGSAYFYPVEIAIKTKKQVHIANPLTNKISKVTKQDIEKREKERKGKKIVLLSAKKIGILVSTKPGQYNIKKALKLNKKFKNSFIFLFNTLNINELENFRDVDCWINTACPRIEYKKIINIKDIDLSY